MYSSLLATILTTLSIPAAEATIASEQSSTFEPVNSSVHDLMDSSTVTRLLAQQTQSRVALVIGNANYADDFLANPVNDATDIAEALRALGFEVTLLLNKDLKDMEDALEIFSRQLREGSIGAFYYAGHGVQVNGENYLIPLNARLASQNDVRYDALALGKVLNVMEESESRVNLILIDACRDNPFYRRWRPRDRNLSSSRGLAAQVPPEGTVISFATSPGNVASDGVGRNSPYTASLLQHIDREGVDISTVLRSVRADVLQETERKQIPWYQESLVGFFSLNPVLNSDTLPEPSTLSREEPTSTSSSSSLSTAPTSSLPQTQPLPVNSRISSLIGYNIDIFFSSSRPDLRRRALSIQENLLASGLESVEIKPYSLGKARELGICSWSEIRYEPYEDSAARELYTLLAQSTTEQSFSLNLLSLTRPQGTTPNYLSIFISDEAAAIEAYPDVRERESWYHACRSR